MDAQTKFLIASKAAWREIKGIEFSDPVVTALCDKGVTICLTDNEILSKLPIIEFVSVEDVRLTEHLRSPFGQWAQRKVGLS